ncbi:uncharacterized protein LOC143283284 [Babylonia areolata]|uniref:uncharacterized protein LOC143283284 n=1 Tax=Babylonia areolata TaxID=304850 RepID=UPI003FD2E4CD
MMMMMMKIKTSGLSWTLTLLLLAFVSRAEITPSCSAVTCPVNSECRVLKIGNSLTVGCIEPQPAFSASLCPAEIAGYPVLKATGRTYRKVDCNTSTKPCPENLPCHDTFCCSPFTTK